MIKNKKQKIILILILIMGLIVLSGFLIYKKVFSINHPSEDKYPIRGIDVSSYQGNINWTTLSNQNIDFAFIKATEGSNYVDERFHYNWSNASKTELKIGAYHFFSYDSPGKSQAQNFINTVDKVEGMMPPVVDIEFYGDKEKNLPDKDTTTIELQVLLDELESYYGMKPIIYATLKSYYLYIKDSFNDYPLWIRNVYYSPNIDMKNEWTFWQYTDQEILDGYKGDEKYIDMNVFNGDPDEFTDFLSYTTD